MIGAVFFCLYISFNFIFYILMNKQVNIILMKKLHIHLIIEIKIKKKEIANNKGII